MRVTRRALAENSGEGRSWRLRCDGLTEQPGIVAVGAGSLGVGWHGVERAVH